MDHSTAAPLGNPYTTGLGGLPAHDESSSSGVSWGAVIGGAFVAAALSLILLALGAGLGLSSVSPWSSGGAAVIGGAAIIWLIVAQILSSAMGGYLAGRLRTKWAHVHTDEVYFRDTAHGLLVWAVGTVITAGLLASAAASMAGGSGHMGGPPMGGGAGPSAMMAGPGEGGMLDPSAYFIDELFRSDRPVADQGDAAVRGEAGRILAHALHRGDFPVTDKTYLAGIVSARTGLAQGDAEQRVAQVFAEAQQALDTARKGAAHLSLWIFVALLAGAFFGSYAATIGGRQRDHVQAI
jgi:hypothetical protein